MGYDMAMFEWDREVRAVDCATCMKGNGNAQNSSKTPLDTMASRQFRPSISNSTASPGSVNTDPAGAATLNQLLTDLGRQKGASV